MSFPITPDRDQALPKCPSGIQGLDEITDGGLPLGRTSLVCGGPGCGKTVFALEFLARGALEHGDPGLFVSFEERPGDLVQNTASLGFRLPELMERRLLTIDHIRVERSEIEETGDYDLEGLFIRLGHAIDQIGARRVALDTIETLFGGLSNTAILRAELRRLFLWLKDRGVTSIVTGEKGDAGLTRQGLEEYVSDCVILLDHRVQGHISTRRLRVVKYRGSFHGTNEYPFLMDRRGITVLPITSVGLDYAASTDRVSTGVARLDEMLEAKGFFRGSTVLVSGTAGAGKTSLAASFADASCRAGERVLYVAFEESPSQIFRNMRSIGMDLERHHERGLLHMLTARPTLHGLESHLAVAHRQVREVRPAAVVVDPLTSLLAAGSAADVESLVLRLIDFHKSLGITTLFTALSPHGGAPETSVLGVSSLIDTWILLKDIELSGERNRTLHILKSRGMAHSNQVKEFLITEAGLRLLDPYLGPEGTLLTGSARLVMEARERSEEQRAAGEHQKERRRRERRIGLLRARLGALQAELRSGSEELDELDRMETNRLRRATEDRAAMAKSRHETGGKDEHGTER
ncbi:MAG TPA: circadian clock protein KaiC [Candidatus Polarisedimenticolia bacterium]|nr:circadian clock protein KaiC [Candidatus Polarisedimenticolia bacterium]